MDVPRKSAARNRKIRLAITLTAVLAAVCGITWFVWGLKPAAPTVERAQVWLDTVKRGPMLRQVRGLGTLVPETPWTIPAMTDGRIERRLALPGTVVNPDTVLLVMSNPQLQQEFVDAEWKLKASEAELNNLKVKLKSERLTQESSAATVETDAHKASMTADRDAELRRLGL
jgi:HlyD family secretion protein